MLQEIHLNDFTGYSIFSYSGYIFASILMLNDLVLLGRALAKPPVNSPIVYDPRVTVTLRPCSSNVFIYSLQ